MRPKLYAKLAWVPRELVLVFDFVFDFIIEFKRKEILNWYSKYKTKPCL
jgi:hypothetical protein